MANIDYKKIAQIAVEEVVKELKKEKDAEKIDKVVKSIDFVDMIAEVVESTIKEMGMDPGELGEEGIKEIAKSSAKGAILEGLKRLG